MRSLLALPVLACLLFGAARAEEGPRVVGQVFVRGDGPVRVDAADLAELGAPSAAHIEVRRHGKTVASWVENGALRFDAVDTAGAHTVHAAYRFWVHAAPRTTERPHVPVPAVAHHVVDADRFYGELASARHEVYSNPAPVWFLARVPEGKTTELPLAPEGLDPAAELRLTAEIRTAHRGEVALAATWGEVDLGSADAEAAATGATLTWTVPAGKAPAEKAPLAFRDESPPIPPPPARDVSAGRGTVWIDALRLSGPPSREPRARTARSFKPRPLKRIPDPLAAAGFARHVIVSVPALLEEARRLAAHRTQTGTPSAVVPVTGIYERYGHGEHTPQAIRAFVLDLRARKDAPLDYLVLAGDATFDRTDMLPDPTVPTLMSRSMYNGVTAADPLYVLGPNGEIEGSPAIGRLPFRKAETLRAYVDRVIRYESKPPAHASRRMFRFITSEARFGALIDGIIENKFRGILRDHIRPAFDVGVTYASTSSPFLWPPPELNDKVIAGLNEGALFFTYVGHGFAEGFDTLHVNGKPHRILHVRDAKKVEVKGTPPVAFVLACTTARFDTLQDCIGEALFKRPKGPVAYWGASRICHPAFNAVMGQAIAMHMARNENAGAALRLGQILVSARDDALAGDVLASHEKMALGMFLGGAKLEHLVVEGAMMYTLLGDPALKLAFPREDVGVAAEVEDGEVVVSIEAALPEGSLVHVSLELPRNRTTGDGKPVENPGDPASYPAIRAKHAQVNDWALLRRDVTLSGGKAEVRLPLAGEDAAGLVVKAWSIAAGDVHQGAAVLP